MSKVEFLRPNGFVVAGKHRPQDITGEFRIGFDKIPTFQNDDFWNIPERYVDVIYPDYPHSMNVEGDYYEYKMQEWNREMVSDLNKYKSHP
jgi:CRISPR-associated protein Cas5h